MDEPLKAKAPIRGWLILVAILAWAAPFLHFLAILTGFVLLHTQQIESEILIVDGFIRMIVSIVILVLFVKRKKSFVKWVLGLEVYAFALETVYIIVRMNSHREILANLIGYIEILVIVLYVTRSNRVKNTFVN